MAHGDTAPPTRLNAEGDTVDGKMAHSSSTGPSTGYRITPPSVPVRVRWLGWNILPESRRGLRRSRSSPFVG
jgi:hypothetical protein